MFNKTFAIFFLILNLVIIQAKSSTNTQMSISAPENLTMTLPTIIEVDNGNTILSAVLELSQLGAGCDFSNDLALADACTLDDELIWEATQISSSWPSQPAAQPNSDTNQSTVEACRAQSTPTISSSLQICIPELQIENDPNVYWLLLNYRHALTGRYFFSLEEHGLTSDPVTEVAQIVDPDTEEFPQETPESLIDLNWPALENSTTGQAVFQQSRLVNLHIVNNSNVDLMVSSNIMFDMGNSLTYGKHQNDQRLLASDAIDLSIDFDDLDYALDNLQSSGKLSVILQIKDINSDEILQSTTSEILYWHLDAATNDMVLYDENVLHSQFRSGDFLSLYADDELYEPGVIVDRVIVGDEVSYNNSDIIYKNPFDSLDSIYEGEEFEIDPEGDDLKQSSNDIVFINESSENNQKSFQQFQLKTCAKFRVQTSDSGIKIGSGFPSAGQTEDYWSSCNNGCNVKARGVLMKIKIGALRKKAYSNPNSGCITWNIQTNKTKYDLTVYTKSKDTNGNIVRMHNATSSFSKYPGKIYAQKIKNQTLFNGTKNIFIGSSSDPKWTAMGSMAFGLYRFHTGLNNKLFNLMALNNCADASAHYGKSTSYIKKGRYYLKIGVQNNSCGAGGSRGKYKFIVNHELGHAIAGLYYGSHPLSKNLPEENVVTNLNTSGNANCNFNNGSSYTIFSKEWNSVGYREGFAHFISAKIWNNKTQKGAFSWFAGPNDLESFDVANTPGGRLENVCGGTLSGRAVIGDWMRFLWDFYNNNSGSCSAQPSKLDMLDMYRNTRLFFPNLKDNYFDSMQGAALLTTMPSCLKQQRFDFYADHNGINH